MVIGQRDYLLIATLPNQNVYTYHAHTDREGRAREDRKGDMLVQNIRMLHMQYPGESASDYTSVRKSVHELYSWGVGCT